MSSEPDHASEAQATQKDERPAIVPGDPSPLDSLDPEDVIEWIENHPESGQLLLSTFSQYFSGPLPPPNLLKGYDDVVPGSAEKIIGQFIEQGEHRRTMEKVVITGDDRRANWGMIAAFSLAFISVAGSLYILNSRDDAVGLGALFLSLAPLITAFLTAAYRRRKELAEKESINPE